MREIAAVLPRGAATMYATVVTLPGLSTAEDVVKQEVKHGFETTDQCSILELYSNIEGFLVAGIQYFLLCGLLLKPLLK